jgi:pyridoxine 5-phosphate synthase
MAGITLCVNVDHIATLRQARGGKEPDPVQGAILCENAGAAGITVHLREDRRHIQDADVFSLKKAVRGKLNLEMALSDDVIAVARKLVPHQVTLVPEKRQEVTTEGGLDVKKNFDRIREVVKMFHDLNVVVSLFVEPDTEVAEKSSEMGADYIELHTGSYCDAADGAAGEHELERIYNAARRGLEAGLRINAGHGLNYRNIVPVLGTPGLEELNIGHSIISRSIFTGIEGAVREMLDIIAAHSPAR